MFHKVIAPLRLNIHPTVQDNALIRERESGEGITDKIDRHKRETGRQTLQIDERQRERDQGLERTMGPGDNGWTPATHLQLGQSYLDNGSMDT